MMAKKYFQKALSVGLSLALCAGLVAPSFAATIAELKNVIDTQQSLTHTDGTVRIGYADGTVTLHEDVQATGSGLHLEGSEYNVTLDLNGQTIAGRNGSGDAVIVLKDGAQLTLRDSSDEQTGKVISGRWGGVSVESGSAFTMTGGTIERNNANSGSASGVTVSGGTFNMEGGTVANNNATGNAPDAPAVLVKGDGMVDMTGGTFDGGNKNAVQVENGGTFTMNGEDAVLKSSIDTVKAAEGAAATITSGAVSNLGDATLTEGSSLGTERNEEGLLTVVPPPEPVVDIPEPEVEIDEPAVPLAAGPVTRAEFIDYLWRHENAPEGGVCTFTDVAADHDFILALGWGEQNGVAEADGEGNFQPDELVTVAAVREFLGNFARVFGMDVDVYALTTLTGEDEEAVLNCDEVLAEFFGEELAGQAA